MPPVNPLAPTAPPDPLGMLTAAHNQAKAMFDHTTELYGKLTPIQSGLEELVKLGDTISPEDVIGQAGKIVAAGGSSPHEMAVILTDMPQAGPSLAQWVGAKLQGVQAQERQLQMGHALARHEMGASAMRLLSYVAQHGAGAQSDQGAPEGGAASPPGQPSANPLTPDSPTAGSA
jgi:hypothetical protein